jgi:serine/threonine-protein kinase
MFVCPECGRPYQKGGFCGEDGAGLVEPADPLLGTMVQRWQVARVLGAGGMGRVYLGVQPDIGSRVAIKVLAEDCARDPDLVERFFSEARAVNLIRHEHIVGVLDLARFADGRPYIVMEFVDGATLGALARQATLPLGPLCAIIDEVLSALAAAHAIGIVHRDLKPDNVLVTRAGHAKVLDFGIAKLAPSISNQPSPRTRTGALLGTPEYMAPEQVASKAVDGRTDLYAYGVMLYETTTGRRPFVGENLFALLRAHLEETPVPPRSWRPELSVELEQVIVRALAKQPEQRFQTAAEMMDALARAASALPPSAWGSLPHVTGTTGLPTPKHRSSRSGREPPSPGDGSPAPMAGHRATVPPSTDPVATQGGRRRIAVLLAAVATVLVVGGVVLGIAVSSGKEPAAAATPGSGSDAGSGTPIAMVPATDAAPAPVPVAVPVPVPPTIEERAKAPRDKDKKKVGEVVVPPPPGGGSGSAVVVTPPPPPPPATTPGRIEEKLAGHDPKRFDAIKFLPHAHDLAKRLLPDARLVRLEVPGVGPDGRADLSFEEDGEAEFWFRSAAASQRPAGLPRNKKVELRCMVYVDVNAQREVEAYVVERDDCDDEKLRPYPKCKLSEVFAKGIAAGVPADLIIKISYLWDGWFISGDDVPSTSVPDDC